MKLGTLLAAAIVLAVAAATALAATDSVVTSEVVVTGKRAPRLYSETSRIARTISREEIKSAPAQSLDDILEYACGLDIRRRGGIDAQADISLRGGSFEQTLILLNGVPVNDPQTGHHNLNIPVEIDDILEIEILEGPGSRALGPNAFAGAINIITGSNKEKNAKLSLAGGQHEYYKTAAAVSYNFDNFDNYVSVVKKGSGPYIENTDFQSANVFYRGGYEASFGEFELQGGWRDKSFGANSFYTAKYPNQYERLKTYFASAKYSAGATLRFRSSAYWRRNRDVFQLFRDNPPDWYSGHNRHITDVFGGSANLGYVWFGGVSSAGFEFRSENIKSNVLGEETEEADGIYDKRASRENIAAFAEHSILWRGLAVSAGALVNWNTDFDIAFYPGVDISYEAFEGFKFFGTVNRSLRLPTFTELYYDSPTNVGNTDLEPEESLSYEVGAKYFGSVAAFDVSVFRREGERIIDWVKPKGADEEAVWRAENITEIIGNGFEASVRILPDINIPPLDYLFLKSLSLNYTYVNLEKSVAGYSSLYALDFLRHKLNFGGRLSYRDDFGAVVKVSFQDRAGEFYDYDKGEEAEYKPVFLTSLRLFASWNVLSFYLEASNLFDVKYNDIANVWMPGRWIRAGVEANIGLDGGQ